MYRPWFIFILLILNPSGWTHGSHSPNPPNPPNPTNPTNPVNTCPSQCECKWKGGKETVTCQNGGYSEVPSGLEPTVQVLDLSGNPLVHVPWQIFRRSGLVHLQRILMPRCSIRTLERTALTGLTNLIELDLSHNLITSVPVHAFDAVPQLRELKLNGNPLVRLNNHVMAPLSQLVRLELANCQLNVVEPRAFQGLELLEWLRLDGNLIESVPAASVAPLRSLRVLELHHNPWHCSCSLRPIRTWLAARNLPFSVPPLCLSPARLRGQSWNRIDPDELACTPTITLEQSLVQVASGQPAVLSCRVQSNPEASVAWFLADRLIANLSIGGEESASADKFQPVYYVSESGTSDKWSHLRLSTTRDQDSGLYVCRAWNKAGRTAANVTLLVQPGTNEPANSAGRGLTAGLLLAGFVTLAVVLLASCCCCIKKVRSPSIRNRLVRDNPIEPYKPNPIDLYLHSVEPENEPQTGDGGGGGGGGQKTPSNHQGVKNSPWTAPASTTIGADENQWLVTPSQADETQLDAADSSAAPGRWSHSNPETHRRNRPMAVFQNHKVQFHDDEPDEDGAEIYDADDDVQSVRSNRRTFPDLVEDSVQLDNRSRFDSWNDTNQDPPLTPPPQSDHAVRAYGSTSAPSAPALDTRIVPYRRPYEPVRRCHHYADYHAADDADDAASVTFFDDSSDATGAPIRPIGHRVSSWSSSLHFDPRSSRIDAYGTMERLQDPDAEAADTDAEDGFDRRYAYHTSQLNRFLAEYRTLQDRLSQMQQACGRWALEPNRRAADHADRSVARRPLRPILKNAKRWNSLDMEPRIRYAHDDPYS